MLLPVVCWASTSSHLFFKPLRYRPGCVLLPAVTAVESAGISPFSQLTSAGLSLVSRLVIAAEAPLSGHLSDRLEVVSHPVLISILRSAYRVWLCSLKRLAVAGNTRENAGPPEQGCVSYCFGLLLSTSGAVVGIFGRGAKGGYWPCSLTLLLVLGIPGLGIATSCRNLTMSYG